jgi:3-phosphoglycerate kinase
MTIHIAINGHYRIGRNVLRDHYESGKIHDVEIVAIIDEPLIGEPASIMAIMRQKGGAVPVPVDLVVSKTFGGDASSRTLASDAAADDDIILDVGRRATAAYERQLGQAGTIVCNGAVGVFEKDAFACGTEGPGEASRSRRGRHAGFDHPVRAQEEHWLHLYRVVANSRISRRQDFAPGCRASSRQSWRRN